MPENAHFGALGGATLLVKVFSPAPFHTSFHTARGASQKLLQSSLLECCVWRTTVDAAIAHKLEKIINATTTSASQKRDCSASFDRREPFHLEKRLPKFYVVTTIARVARENSHECLHVAGFKIYFRLKEGFESSVAVDGVQVALGRDKVPRRRGRHEG